MSPVFSKIPRKASMSRTFEKNRRKNQEEQGKNA
jgi:hypothetical protein